MPKKIEIPEEELQGASKFAESAKTPHELRMAQTILAPGLLGLSDQATAVMLGCSRSTVLRLRKRLRAILSGKEGQERNWGGRRYGHMSLEEEKQFLSGFLKKASEGSMLVVSEIKSAFESQVGQSVAKTTIYRMLERHGWRKIMPRPRHPKGKPEDQEGFKKTPEAGHQVRKGH